MDYRILLLLFIFYISAEGIELRILYVNDFYGFAIPYKPTGSKKFFDCIKNSSQILASQKMTKNISLELLENNV
jgi:hypothetical protein